MFAEAEVPPAVHPRNVQSTTFAPTNGRFQHRTAALIDPEQLKQAGLAFGCAASLDLVIGIPAVVITSSGIGHQSGLGAWQDGSGAYRIQLLPLCFRITTVRRHSLCLAAVSG